MKTSSAILIAVLATGLTSAASSDWSEDDYWIEPTCPVCVTLTDSSVCGILDDNSTVTFNSLCALNRTNCMNPNLAFSVSHQGACAVESVVDPSIQFSTAICQNCTVQSGADVCGIAASGEMRQFNSICALNRTNCQLAGQAVFAANNNGPCLGLLQTSYSYGGGRRDGQDASSVNVYPFSNSDLSESITGPDSDSDLDLDAVIITQDGVFLFV